jgi:purine-nucleoside phosphorylase
MNDLNESLKYIRSRTDSKPKIGIILGSGLGVFADKLDSLQKISTSEIPHYPKSTVEGHAGNFVFGNWKNVPILAIQGRTHFYEGYPIEKVTYVVRIMAALGIKILMVTNASGAVNPDFSPGDLMLITDQINGMFRNPLIGPLKYGGDRFPDMSNPYTSEYFETIEKIAKEKKINLRRGTLYTSTGPTYETAAEVKMIRKLGGDIASMSTVPEVITANQAGLKVIGISCITNLATGIGQEPLSHSEVTETADKVREKFIQLVSGIIEQLGKDL